MTESEMTRKRRIQTEARAFVVALLKSTEIDEFNHHTEEDADDIREGQMSRVTNVILTYPDRDGRDTDGNHPADFINAHLFHIERGQRFGPNLSAFDSEGGGSSVVGGLKMLETSVHIAAFNHIDVDALRQVFAAYTWEHPHLAQIMIQDQEEDAFSVETAADIRAGKPRRKVEL